MSYNLPNISTGRYDLIDTQVSYVTSPSLMVSAGAISPTYEVSSTWSVWSSRVLLVSAAAQEVSTALSLDPLYMLLYSLDGRWVDGGSLSVASNIVINIYSDDYLAASSLLAVFFRSECSTSCTDRKFTQLCRGHDTAAGRETFLF